jgi:hypothetical protein
MPDILGYEPEDVFRAALVRGLTGIGRKDVKDVTGERWLQGVS